LIRWPSRPECHGAYFDGQNTVEAIRALANTFVGQRVNIYRLHSSNSWELTSAIMIYRVAYWNDDVFNVNGDGLTWRFVNPRALAVESMYAFWVAEFDNPVICDLGYFYSKLDHR